MLRHRVILLILSLVVVLGSVAGTLGYAMHIRSDAYRTNTQQQVSDILELPVVVGSIQPLTFTSSLFENVKVTLPSTGSEIFHCDQVTWREIQRGDKKQHALDLHSGTMLIGNGDWSKEEYKTLLKSGLGQDFESLDLREIHLEDIDFSWTGPDFDLAVQKSWGEVLIDKDGMARASLYSRQMNSYPVDDPIHIHAVFEPGKTLRFDAVNLTVPQIPLSAFGLDRLLAGPVDTGTFMGQIRYEENGNRYLVARGSVQDASLDELTRMVIGGPFRGKVNVTLDELEIIDRDVEILRFRGALDNVSVGDVLPFGEADLSNTRASLSVHQFDFEAGLLARANITGEAWDIPFDLITQYVGCGKITGKLQARIISLNILNEKVQHAEIELIATPPPGEPGMIDKEVLQRIGQEYLGMDLESVLPTHIEYTQLGARVIVDGSKLKLRGTHGHSGNLMLTIKMFGREMGLIPAPDREFEIEEPIALLREKIEGADYREVREWWKTLNAVDESSQ